MTTFLIVLAIIVSILLIVVVLVQDPKGSGLTGQTGASASQVFGAQRSGDIFEKLTWGLVAVILVSSILVTSFGGGSKQENSNMRSVNLERAKEQVTVPDENSELANPETTTTGDSTQN
ncbi:preprotein translocase subunit SecG [Hugenholtzia roseola]|uniref:preprotein translocase subunit SecG n=1 Tax=Hugenholtzia roseola TaxID=1002 RepID=UPI0003FB5CEA|nr:preprotein translocase subunit SecG [Hugenholtzia roseola]